MSHTISHMTRWPNLTAIDLFAGCGGISCGLEMAGFNVLAGIDIEQKFLSTFENNFGSSRAFNFDVTSVSPSDFMKELDIERGELTLLAGGPPCQGFSKNVPRKYRYLEDPRNQLILTFLDYCEAFLPRFILMENVAEMKNGFEQSYTQEIVERLSEMGYAVGHHTLNAADYGIPQRRKRAFFLACRNGKTISAPSITHYKSTEQSLLFESPYVSVWDAIGDLPPLKHGEGSNETSYHVEAFSTYQRLMRNESGKVSNHVARKLQPTQLERLAALKPGEGLRDLPEHLQVNGGYSGAYGRLTKTMVAPTITRWVFHPGSGRWGHPVDTRVLSIREVARIQGFPDWFTFVGSYTQQAGQLGNAVPPMLAQQVAEHMLHLSGDLQELSRSAIKSSKSNLFSELSSKSMR